MQKENHHNSRFSITPSILGPAVGAQPERRDMRNTLLCSTSLTPGRRHEVVVALLAEAGEHRRRGDLSAAEAAEVAALLAARDATATRAPATEEAGQ